MTIETPFATKTVPVRLYLGIESSYAQQYFANFETQAYAAYFKNLFIYMPQTFNSLSFIINMYYPSLYFESQWEFNLTAIQICVYW